MVDIGGLTRLGTTIPFQHISDTPVVSYPYTTDDGPYTILGPVLLPQIYGKDLNAIEVGSSGIIALSIYDKNVLNINSNLNTAFPIADFNMITVESQSLDDAIQLRSGTNANKVVLDSLLVSELGTQNVISTSKSSILMDNAVEVSGTLSVKQNVTISSKLSVEDTVTLSSTLSVGGITTFADNMFVEGVTMKIPAGTTSERPVFNLDTTVPGSAPAGSIYYDTESSQFQGLHDDSVWRQFGGVIDSDGDTAIKTGSVDEDTLFFHANDANTPRMTMTETELSVNLHVIHSETLSVAKTTVLASNLSVGEYADISGTLSVGGATYINNTLHVQDASILMGTVTAHNPVLLKSSLSVEGVSYFKDNVIVNGELNTVSPVFMHDMLSVNGSSHLNSSLVVIGETTLTDKVTMSNTLDVHNNTTLNSNVTVSDSLSVNGPTTFANYLSVGGLANISQSLSVGGVTVLQQTLSVTQGVTFGATLSVKGSTVIKDTLTVTGATTLNSGLSISGNIVVGSADKVHTNTVETTDDASDMYINLGDGTDGTLYVQGNLNVKGSVSTYNSVVENVTVMDKRIVLASGQDTVGENDAIVDDKSETNHKSGIEIEGLPVNLTDGSNNPYYSDPNVGNVYEKSFLWNVSEEASPNGQTDGLTFTGPLMTLNDNRGDITNIGSVDKEAFWELKGGQLRISSVFKDLNGDLEKISYSMRITKNKELQFMKHEWKKELGVFTRKTPVQVATFGVNFSR